MIDTVSKNTKDMVSVKKRKQQKKHSRIQEEVKRVHIKCQKCSWIKTTQKVYYEKKTSKDNIGKQ